MIRNWTHISLFILVGLVPVQAQVSIQDSLALVSLYNATDGANWKNNTNWLQGPVSTWHGVTLLGDRIYILNLYDNGLNGHIPSQIGQLTKIVELDLRKSSFTGEIPDVFGQMSELYQLSLSECGLTGEIPSSLGNCLKLGRLSVSKNQLTGSVPASMEACTQMIHLHVRQNNLTGPFPEVIRSWQGLEQLDLAQNSFSGSIPPWIAELDDLYWLFLDEIPFEGPTPFLGDKPNLNYLYITHNLLTGNLEDILGYYPNLTYCLIDQTNFSGRLSPDHFNPQKMVELTVLYSGIDQLGNFTEWVNYPNFSRIIVSNNYLDFDDLVQNSTMASNKFLWYPQNPIGTDTTIALFPGEDFLFQSPMQDPDIVYQWYKDNQLINGANGPLLAFNPFTPDDIGEYFFMASYPVFPGYSILSAVATLEEETSAITVMESDDIQVFPNPVLDQLTMVFDFPGVYQSFNLLNEHGQVLRTQTITGGTTHVSLFDVPSGIYFLHIHGAQKNYIKRIVKF